jgi:anthranilate synthase/aminodeoxychorismate synthase-like glutamine amidotransferase
MILMIDNYDSFTYNLVQAMSVIGAELTVVRNDEVTLDWIESRKPAALVVSPGPCTPTEAGVSLEAVRRFSGRIPVLGVCLGHQCLGAAFGGIVTNAKSIMHGKASQVEHDGSTLYEGVRSPFTAGRYHSLAVAREPFPADFVIDAWTEDGEVMGMHHTEYPTFGVQYHPESVLTPMGSRVLRNFIRTIGGATGEERN